MSINGISLNTLIKNTFISVPVPSETSPTRRSVSLPPGVRLAHSTIDDDKELQRKPSWADVSTDEDSTPSETAHGVDTDTDECSSCGAPSPTAPVTPLSSKAALFRPGGASFMPCQVVQDPLPYTFGQEAARMVTIMKKAVEESELAWQVEVVNQASGWFISIQMNEESHTEQVRTIAKQALLDAALESSCTYVLGYLSKPFVATPDGFTATLGAMRDESLACWDVYRKGVCRSAGQCGCLHPRCMMQLNVTLWV